MTELYERSGPEFLASEGSAGEQSFPAIASLASGFVMAWRDNRTALPFVDETNIKARLFDASGTPTGPEILVNQPAESDEGFPEITALASGGFVVTWDASSGRSANGGFADIEVRAQLLDASGTKLGSELFVNTVTDGYQARPQIAPLTSGGFVITWSDNSGAGDDDSGFGVKGQIFDAFGDKIGGEFSVNTMTSGDQLRSPVASLTSGGFVVSWENGDDQTVRAQVFDGKGRRIGTEVKVDETAKGSQLFPDIAPLASGGYVVTWREVTTEEDLSGERSDIVKARRFDPDGIALGDAFLVNSGPTVDQNFPAVSPLASGGFVISWDDQSGAGEDTSYTGVKGQTFNAAGQRIGEEFLVNTVTEGFQNLSDVSGLTSGGFVTAWISEDESLPFRDRGDIKAQVFTLVPDGTLRLGDGDDVFTAPSDAPVAVDGGAGDDRIEGGGGDDRFTGGEGRDIIAFDNRGNTGLDEITDFGPTDVIATRVRLRDGNGDGVITLGGNGLLDLSAAGGGQVRLGGVDALRFLGSRDGEFYYADADTRPRGAAGGRLVEGAIGPETLTGSASAPDIFFVDSALGLPLGRDAIRGLGPDDLLVTTTPLRDGNGDGVIDFARRGFLDIAPDASAVLTGEDGSRIRRLEFDGEVAAGDVRYFVYSLVGSDAGTGDLIPGG